jgi:hypothetical protein
MASADASANQLAGRCERQDRIVPVAHRRELLTALTGRPATGNIL